MLPTERRRCLSLLLPPCLALLLLLQPHSSVAPGGDLRGGSPQWLGRKKDARTVTVRPGDEDTASNMARAFERGEGGLMGADPTHGGRGDHTELLDLADYTKKKKHPRERTRAVPKGFHMPGERKDDGVRGPHRDPPVHGTASSVSHAATPRNALCASAAHTAARPIDRHMDGGTRVPSRSAVHTACGRSRCPRLPRDCTCNRSALYARVQCVSCSLSPCTWLALWLLRAELFQREVGAWHRA
jgi:hypothetical protein